VGTWFGFLATPAIFASGLTSALAVLFPPLFWYGVGCGGAALVGALGSPREGRRGLRLLLGAIVTAGALAEAVVVDPLVRRLEGAGPGFGAAHTLSVVVALITWAAAIVGLLSATGVRSGRP